MEIKKMLGCFGEHPRRRGPHHLPGHPQVYKRMKLQIVISAVEMWTKGDQVTATHSLDQTLQVFTSWCQKDAAVRIEYDHVELLL